MSDSIQQYMERPKFYANIDGTGEMCVGVCILGMILPGYLQAILPKDSLLRHGFPSLLLFEFTAITFCWLGYFGSKAIKNYITYPRTGYVALRRPKDFSWTKVAFVSVVAVAIAAGMVLAARHMAIVPLRLVMVGICVVSWCVMGLFFARTSRWKWFVYGLLALGLATIFLATDGRFEDAAQRGMLLASLTYLASGAATFFLYMRGTKPGRIE